MRLWLLKEMCRTGCLEHMGTLVRVGPRELTSYLCYEGLTSVELHRAPEPSKPGSSFTVEETGPPEGQCLASRRPGHSRAYSVHASPWSCTLWLMLQHLVRWDVKGQIT